VSIVLQSADAVSDMKAVIGYVQDDALWFNESSGGVSDAGLVVVGRYSNNRTEVVEHINEAINYTKTGIANDIYIAERGKRYVRNALEFIGNRKSLREHIGYKNPTAVFWTDETTSGMRIVADGRYVYPMEYPGLVSFDRETMSVGYFQNHKHMVAGRITTTRLGRYLKKLSWDEPKIAEAVNRTNVFLNAVAEGSAKYALTPEECVEVYENGPNSCMSGNSFGGHVHPCSVYGTPNIAVAYAEIEGRGIVARAVINLDKKEYLDPYGNEELLHALLKKDGYEPNDNALEGGLLHRIRDDAVEFIMPYLDGRCDSVNYHSEEYFEIVYSGEYTCQQTHGGVVEGYYCDDCGDTNSEDYHYGYLNGHDISVCHSCIDGYEYVGDEYVSRDDLTWSDHLDRYVRDENVFKFNGRIYDDATHDINELEEEYNLEHGDYEDAA